MTADTRKINGVFVNFVPSMQVPKQGGGTYPGFMFTYTVNGQVRNVSKHANTLKYNKQLEKQLRELVAGDNIVVIEEKNAQGFIDIKGVHKVAEGDDGMAIYPNTSETVAPSPAPDRQSFSPKANTTGRDFETKEERAVKQVAIARQSSLQRSLEFLTLVGNKKASPQEVVEIADFFVNYVENGVQVQDTASTPTVENMGDDIPF